MGVSEELGGYVSITVAIIVLTGVLGNMWAESVCKLFKIEEPIAKCIAIGTASHAIGTSKAMELGDIEGAMSSLSIVVSTYHCNWCVRICTIHVRYQNYEMYRMNPSIVS